MTAQLTKIGIIKPCCIGDAVMALPAIESIGSSDPQIHIQIWTGKHSRPVFEHHPSVDSIIEISSIPTTRDVPRLISMLRGQSAVDGYISLDRSRLLATALRLARVDVLGTIRGERDADQHETAIYLEAIKQAGFQASVKSPTIRFSQSEVESARRAGGVPAGPYVVLHPGGAENPGVSMHSKRWPTDSWKRIISWLDSIGMGVVLTGSPDELDLCSEVAAGTSAVIAAGKLSLIESAMVASAARAFVGPDTGLAHLAAAGGAPVVVIFGPTNPHHYAPRGRYVEILAPPGSWKIRRGDLRRDTGRALPSPASVPVEEVVDALGGILNGAGTDRC